MSLRGAHLTDGPPGPVWIASIGRRRCGRDRKFSRNNSVLAVAIWCSDGVEYNCEKAPRFYGAAPLSFLSQTPVRLPRWTGAPPCARSRRDRARWMACPIFTFRQLRRSSASPSLGVESRVGRRRRAIRIPAEATPLARELSRCVRRRPMLALRRRELRRCRLSSARTWGVARAPAGNLHLEATARSDRRATSAFRILATRECERDENILD